LGNFLGNEITADGSQKRSIPKLCLFAHYDQDGLIGDHVRAYLDALGGCGFSIVVISTAPLVADACKALPPHVLDVIVRENSGLDFGSWAHGFREWAHRCEGDLLLANDSVYAPVGDLEAALARLTAEKADIFGMVASNEVRPHLQSWFLLFRDRVWRHPDFSAFLNQPFGDFTKTEVILRGEVGLAEFAKRNGFRMHAAFPRRDAGTLPLTIVVNPTHFLWREIVCDAELPFIKVQLLRDNPMMLPELSDWKAIAAARAPLMEGLIESHLQRVGRQPDVERDHPARNLFADYVRRDYVAARAGDRMAQWLNRLRFRVTLLPAQLRDLVEPIPVIGPALKAAWHFAKGDRRA
jgi:lipopolysaccharide biosynthesis protein